MRGTLSTWMISFSVILVFVSILPGQIDPEQRRRLEVNRKTKPYTRLLPLINKIELSKVGQLTADGEIASIAATKVIEGRDVRTIASLWRAQTWDYNYSGMCHTPAYVVKFYSGEKLIVHASVCWACGNIQFRESNITGVQGFASHSKAAQSLLKVFNEEFSKAGQ